MPWIEDWGCGLGGFRAFVPAGKYRGIDGSHSPFADEVVDLTTYTSEAEGVFIRHVLGHDHAWEAILRNAVASFRRKLVLVLFTPFRGSSSTDCSWNWRIWRSSPAPAGSGPSRQTDKPGSSSGS